MRFGIQRRIGALAAALVVLTAASMWLVTQRARNEILFSQAKGQLHSELSTSKGILEDAIQKKLVEDVRYRAEIVTTIMRNRGIGSEQFETDPEARRSLVEMLERFLTVKKSYLQARYIDRNGQEVARVDRTTTDELRITPDDELQNKGNTRYVTEALKLAPQRVYLSDVALNREVNQVIRGSSPVYEPGAPADAKPVGVFVVNMDFQALTNGLRFSHQESDGEADRQSRYQYITNNKGYFLMNTEHPNLVFGFERGPVREDLEGEKLEGRSGLISEDYPDLAAYFEDADKNMGELLVTGSGANKRAIYFVKYHFDEEKPDRFLGLAIALSYAGITQLDRQSVSVRNRMLWMGLLLILVAIVAARYFAAVITQPLRRITEATERFGQGTADASETLPVTAQDEIGALARAFDDMRRKVREQEKEIVVARDEALAAARTKSVFLANMSHELRTPLNGIIGYSEMLEEEAEEQELADFIPDLKKINIAGRHLRDLINAVLDLSRIEAGKMEVYLEEFDIEKLVTDVTAVIQPLAKKNQNELVVICPDDIGHMRADETKVRQSVINLLSNACKFTEKGTVTLKAARLRLADDEWVAFQVTDTGIGMTAQQMDKVFEQFAQADASISKRFGGTGLGLSLTKLFSEMMGGNVDVKSEIGKGTTFTIRLPASLQKDDGTGADLQTVGLPAVPDDAPTVLVIDDDATVRDLVERFLRKDGFNAVTAAGGQAGLDLAKKIRPNSILVDVMMPGMDGWAVLTSIKNDPDLKHIPVIMHSIVDDKSMGYTLGASDYLTKPVEREQLTAVLNKYRSSKGTSTVLLVDDDANGRSMVRRMLERDGCEVIEAEHGEAALACLEERQPSFILLDLMMPVMDGFELVQHMRKREEWRTIPIVVVTAKTISPEDRARLNGMVSTILQKADFSMDELFNELRDLVRSACGKERQPESGAVRPS